jgi:hypothetical protein
MEKSTKFWAPKILGPVRAAPGPGVPVLQNYCHKSPTCILNRQPSRSAANGEYGAPDLQIHARSLT